MSSVVYLMVIKYVSPRRSRGSCMLALLGSRWQLQKLFLGDPEINWTAGLGVSLFNTAGDMSKLASEDELGYERRAELQIWGNSLPLAVTG